MDKPELRPILSNLRQHLSEKDRERLNPYVQHDGSKSIESLKLIQSFLDQDKISEKDFSLLIDAFKQIQCYDAANLLKGHQHRMVSNDQNQSLQNLASIMSLPVQDVIYNPGYEDPYVAAKLIEDQLDYRGSNEYETIDRNNSTNNGDVEKTTSSRKPCFCVPLLKNKYLILSSILFLLTLAALIGVLIGKKYQIDEAMNTIEQLNKKIAERSNERNITLIKAGQKFGADIGYDSDDSLLENFTTSHYLSEVRFSDIDGLYACQFIYRSCYNDDSRIESNVYGEYGREINSTYEYNLDDDDRIQEVRVQSFDKEFLRDDNSPLTIKIITGLQFITTYNKSIPPDVNLTGDGVQSESFPGYTLGYVTGKSALRIDQLQFFWYRITVY